jgi:hypothetical protein
MIAGIDRLYQQIAGSIQGSIPGQWEVAWIDAIFYSEHTFYSAEYVTREGGASISFATDRAARLAFVELREMFRQAGKPLWCRARFQIYSDGRFNMKWGYDDCDENGFARFDEEAELKRMRDLLDRS